MELVDAATDASEATLTSSAGFNPPAPTHTQTHTHSPTFVVSIGYADKSAARSVTGGRPCWGASEVTRSNWTSLWCGAPLLTSPPALIDCLKWVLREDWGGGLQAGAAC